MKIKLFALLICILTISTLCYATSSKDYVTKKEWQSISEFYQNMKTCKSAQFNTHTDSLRVYKNGSSCIYEEINMPRHRTITCELPLKEVKTFAKNATNFNSIILNNMSPDDIQELFNNKNYIEYTDLQTKYCK